MPIVADTSALLALSSCEGFLLLDKLFKEVSVPQAVLRECTVPGKPNAGKLGSYLADKVDGVDLSGFVAPMPPYSVALHTGYDFTNV